MTPRIWEHDDYPRGRRRTLRVFDRLRERYPGFKVTLFAIPAEMQPADFAAVAERSEWMRLALHGFFHDKGECREPTTWRQYLPWLDELAADARWSRLFKAPWHGIDVWLAQELANRGIACCVKTIPFFPYPMPDGIRCCCLHDLWIGAGKDDTRFVESHPVYTNPNYFKAAESEISDEFVARWTEGWRPDDEFAFSEDFARPLCLKLNLACGPQVWPGWVCLDHRKTAPEVVEWDMMSCRLPYGNEKVDAIAMSHALAHLPEERYAAFFCEAFRVLRPGAVFRFSENDTASGYVWRRPGESSRGNGPIRSMPTKQNVVGAMQQAGFAVYDAEPGTTRSPHHDLVQMDSRFRRWSKKQTFCVEAIKAVAVLDIARSSHKRAAAPRDLRERYL